MAELADALDLGSSTFGVQVQLLSPAPNMMIMVSKWISFFMSKDVSRKIVKMNMI